MNGYDGGNYADQKDKTHYINIMVRVTRELDKSFKLVRTRRQVKILQLKLWNLDMNRRCKMKIEYVDFNNPRHRIINAECEKVTRQFEKEEVLRA